MIEQSYQPDMHDCDVDMVSTHTAPHMPLQNRVLVCVPTPQVVLHAPQALHEDHEIDEPVQKAKMMLVLETIWKPNQSCMIGSGTRHQHKYRTCHPNKYGFAPDFHGSLCTCPTQTMMTKNWACQQCSFASLSLLRCTLCRTCLNMIECSFGYQCHMSLSKHPTLTSQSSNTACLHARHVKLQ